MLAWTGIRSCICLRPVIYRINKQCLGSLLSTSASCHRVQSYLPRTPFSSLMALNSVSVLRRQYGSSIGVGQPYGGEKEQRNDDESDSGTKASGDKLFSHRALIVVVGSVLFLYVTEAANRKECQCSEAKDVLGNASKRLPHLPTYAANDVAAHDSKDKGIWVSFKNGVYDITKFVDKHPGGDKILLGAGGDLEPFWMLFAVHQSKQVLEMLEEYRIGNLQEDDVGESTRNMSDPYAGEPRRHPTLKPSSVKPFNAEPPMQLLVESHLTPNDIFFIRNHLPVPHINPDTYELEIEGVGMKNVTLSLNDLKTKFHQHSVNVTLQCAGNRRSELAEIKPIKGLYWGGAAISNACWTGVRLRDLLLYAGFDEKDERVKHIQFEGLDTDVTGTSYGASILREKALDPLGDVLVAFEMNGKPIPLDHGFPVRLVAPGIVGARNVKWLGRIVASEEESQSHWQQNDYKGFSSSVDWDTVDFKSAPAIQELPIQSAICDPANNAVVAPVDGCVVVKGYSWSGGGRKVVRVDVSSDGGKTWVNATLQPDSSSLTRAWSWRLWEAKVPLPSAATVNSEVELICKATDSSYNTQSDNLEALWNLRGVLNNAWYRIKIKVGPQSSK